MSSSNSHHDDLSTSFSSSKEASRKLCVRHKQMANQNVNAKLQKSLDSLPVPERAAITSLWSTFSAAPDSKRKIILEGILTMCCFSQLSHLSDSLNRIIRIDPFTLLPREISLKILGYLDAISLGRAAQVSLTWKSLADDDLLWRRMCGQHIDRKCEKCGWGLPLLERRRLKTELKDRSPAAALGVGIHDHNHDGHDGIHQVMTRSEALAAMPPSDPYHPIICGPSAPGLSLKRAAPGSPMTWPQVKKARLYGVASDSEEEEEHDDPTPAPAPTAQSAGASLTRDLRLTRPWKSVYCERLVVERNWRKGRCQTKTINGAHTDGILCLQYHNTLSSPDYPVLITGSYDRTVRIWNLDTGEQVRVLTGHTRAVRALQFNQMLLFTGSLDGTVRMWNWRKGEVMRVFEDHIDGVTSVNYNGYLLASGSSDNTVCVRNFRTGGRFFLRGHEEPVNQVLLWDGKTSPADLDPMAPPRFTAQRVRQNKSPGVEAAPGDDVDVGQMLFSASDDVVKLWDLTTQQVVRTFSGHRAPIYSIKVIMVDKPDDDDDEEDDRERHTSPTAALVSGSNGSSLNQNQSASHLAPPGFNASHHSTIPIDEITPRVYVHSDDESERRTKKRSSPKPKRDEKCAMLVTSSHDGTVKLWDVETGRERNTLFGHIEGVWTVDMDALRLASGSYDRTIKVWDRQSGNCVQTLVGHRGAVTALQLSDDMIVSGSDNGDIMTWSFAPQKTVAAASPTPTPTQ